MNPFNRDAASKVDVRQVPVNIPGEGPDAAIAIKVDASICVDGVLLVAGWRSRDLTIGLRSGGEALHCELIAVSRPDVAEHLGLEREDLGFVLVAHVGAPEHVMLECTLPGGGDTRSWPLRVDHVESVGETSRQVFRPVIGQLLQLIKPYTGAWSGLVSALPGATGANATDKGHIDVAVACTTSGLTVVSGWLVCDPQTPVWLETAEGAAHDLRGARRSVRTDVLAAIGKDHGANPGQTGFTALIPRVAVGGPVALKTMHGGVAHVLARQNVTELPSDPAAASRVLFEIGTPVDEFAARLAGIDRPIIDPLLQTRAQGWERLESTCTDLGHGPANPAISIIVPLYGRLDFVEHQIIEFSHDAWLTENAEIIYVVDDPALVSPMRREARALHELYGFPFRWVWGGANRGFSGANNLGAAHARASRFVFLNSDAFPRRAGWARELQAVLDERPDIGAVGPRLLFADGSIQHAGMEFRRRDDLGIWVNHHPRMGLDPRLDPCTSLSIVPAITGACLAMRRSDFDRIGGWDTGYLIGDFEDSDLCLKLRAEGLSIAYLPTVELTHLERQSFRMLGSGEYRTKVVIYNAVRHQERWGQMIEASASAAH